MYKYKSGWVERRGREVKKGEGLRVSLAWGPAEA